MMQNQRRKRFPIITKKIIASILISGTLLCAAIFSVGYITFSRKFRLLYDSNLRAIAAAAKEVINPDSFEKYLATNEKDEEYNNIEAILQKFTDKFELNFIYVSQTAAPEYTSVTYIYDVVGKQTRFTPFPLGYNETYVEANYNKTARKVLEEGKTLIRHTMKTRSGSHITAMFPVYDSNNKIVAMCGAQKSIQEYVNSLASFAAITIVVSLVFAIVFSFLFSVFFNVKIISPLILITKETDHFASWGGKPSDKLLEIKNHDEIGILAHSLHQMEYDVCRNIEELTRVTAEKERIGTELNLAAKIQLDALPTGYPPFPERTEFDLFASMSPAKEVGGDLFNYQMIGQDKLLLLVGDVSGKGVPAALFMMTANTLISIYAENNLSPAEIFTKTNNKLCEGNESNLFVTAWLGILDLKSGELKYVNAGHPHPILYHGGQFSYLTEKPNFILAGMSGVPYKEYSLQIEKDDRLFIYTDGVTEATDSNEKLFGEERLMKAIQGTQSLNAPDTLVKIRKDIDAFAGDAEQFDDITMLQFIRKEI